MSSRHRLINNLKEASVSSLKSKYLKPKGLDVIN